MFMIMAEDEEENWPKNNFSIRTKKQTRRKVADLREKL
jgi:hypothetical protein